MAPFIKDVDDQLLDFEILRNGGFSVYRRLDFLREDISWLRERQYQITEFDCKLWKSHDVLHDIMSSSLGFPDYYGKNFSALNECLLDDLSIPFDGGLGIVLSGFGRYAQHSKEDAATLLRLFARASREWMLTGHRLLFLIQSDDPTFRFDIVESVSTSWNRREWLSSSRGV